MSPLCYHYLPSRMVVERSLLLQQGVQSFVFELVEEEGTGIRVPIAYWWLFLLTIQDTNPLQIQTYILVNSAHIIPLIIIYKAKYISCSLYYFYFNEIDSLQIIKRQPSRFPPQTIHSIGINFHPFFASSFMQLLSTIQNTIQLIPSYNQLMMKSLSLTVLALCLALTSSLPFSQQIALLNSLEVGRNEDPIDWTCVGCDETNKPIQSYVIEEKAVEIRAILSVYEEYTVLAFRYTANLKNVWQDILWAFQVQDEDAPKGCKVQREYDRMWAKIRSDVLAGLRLHVHPRRLIVTGISLGGGLAAISFVDIQASKEFDNVEVITFGAPRVGNKKWAKWFDSITDSTRIYIRRDPIAFLPRCLTLLCNYRQTGNPIVCYPGKKECRYKKKSVEDELEMPEAVSYLLGELNEHKEEIADGEFGGILDHIFGYKKIKDYTLVI